MKDYKTGEIVFVNGHFFKVNGKTNTGWGLDLLTEKEVAELYHKEMSKEMSKESKRKSGKIYRVQYINGDLSREFQSLGKTLKVAERKHGAGNIMFYMNGELVWTKTYKELKERK